MTDAGTDLVSQANGLSAQQEAFVTARLKGRSVEEAMADAGYQPDDWLRVIHDPVIAQAIESGIKALATHSAVDAFMLTRSINNLTSADRVKVDAARLVLGIAGHVAPTRVPARERQANLAEMGSDDLRQLVEQLQGELAVRATPVNAPIAPVAPLKVADFLD